MALQRTDEELLAEWYAARGKDTPRLPMSEVPRMIKALRITEEDELNPKPLIHCPICNVLARGEHNPKS